MTGMTGEMDFEDSGVFEEISRLQMLEDTCLFSMKTHTHMGGHPVCIRQGYRTIGRKIDGKAQNVQTAGPT